MDEIARPALGAPSFACPECGAFAGQTWFSCFSKVATDAPEPIDLLNLEGKVKGIPKLEDRNEARAFWHKKALGYPYIADYDTERVAKVPNMALAKCFACREFSVWLNDELVFPRFKYAVPPNVDMPDDVAIDFREAATIVDLSPRGAAALLRLAVQRLCKHLGEKGDNINDDIASLVKNGLSKKIQKSLDILRVIGNDSVHPGQIDLNDDKETAYALFWLVNVIVETMISEPKHIDEAYLRLPEAKRKAIEKRDAIKP